MFDKIQMTVMMKTSISNNRISRLNKCFTVFISTSITSDGPIAILSLSGHKNLSDLSFLPDILVSYVVFEIY